ncbi:MAG: serine/threonine protein kinase [Leptolyngbyaceae cyanobacterium MAG.088]|nr:serine/threonine protein kinase [Leptolyngbyaceae cyanobacterium MAG.088]
MDPFINQVLCQRYKIRTRLSQKPGRRTFIATDLNTNTTVVVKLLLFDMEFTWEHLKLFKRESTALRSLEHPAIPKYLDFVDIETELGKGFLLVQTYMKAKSLQEWVTAGRTFSDTELHHIAQDALNILEYLHNRNPAVIHRDIKPSNLLLTEPKDNAPGQIYLVDFGGIQAPQQGSTVTVIGTYGYMPLEQFGGRAVAASDLYSLGATLIYLATGQHPANLPQKNMRLQFADKVHLSSEFTNWLSWLTEPDLAKRPGTAAIARKGLNEPEAHSAPEKARVQQPAGLSRLHPLREPTPTHSVIKLSHIQNDFNIQVPGKNIKFEALFHRLKRKGMYSLTFSRTSKGAILSLVELHKGKSRKLFQQPLTQMIASPDRVPYYRITLKSEGRFPSLRIKGSYHEIRWICDELDTWSRMPVLYRSALASEGLRDRLALKESRT